ncbi:MAG: Holliday junction branch migration protein RuvA [Gammaproteobacteria bacterium]|jgi:Holliday junction DNA helicase RuvA|nr:Holliday junction branch migration protein RuvA [Gammaproteobacteria bacterium]MDH3749458.1 Holliday junction branch migration protein RuvA [Gammaproteobacteria bacterium]MDH3805999.1 Holliday junction branch migration protein RuvA [Gammaproteobacteria bacterium]
MIGSLRGNLTAKQAPQIIIECHGVGYEVETPMSTFLDLPDIGADLFLHTHLLVREDAQTLYGFGSVEERSLFRMLLRISGVGAKMSLAILSTMSVADFQRCVEFEDAATLVRIPGVGKKTAERLIIEMRDKIDKAADTQGVSIVQVEASPRSEAVDALIALGYKASEVNKLIGAMDVNDKSAEDIIRSALRQAAQ